MFTGVSRLRYITDDANNIVFKIKNLLMIILQDNVNSEFVYISIEVYCVL